VAYLPSRTVSHPKDMSCPDLHPLICLPRRPMALGTGRIPLSPARRCR
jgi:hypothetical protein